MSTETHLPLPLVPMPPPGIQKCPRCNEFTVICPKCFEYWNYASLLKQIVDDKTQSVIKVYEYARKLHTTLGVTQARCNVAEKRLKIAQLNIRNLSVSLTAARRELQSRQ